MNSRNAIDPKKIIDLTNDDAPNSRIVINIPDSDSDDELFRPNQAAFPKQVKSSDKHRQPPENSRLQQERKPLYTQFVTVPVPFKKDKSEASKVSRNIDKKHVGPVSTSTSKNLVTSHARPTSTSRDNEPVRQPGLIPNKTVPPKISAELNGQQAVPGNTERQNPHGQTLTKPHRLHCTECTETGLECDGEQPCSRCVEPGLDCRYSNSQLRTEPSKAVEILRTENEPIQQKPRQRETADPASTSRSLSRDLGSHGSEVPLMNTSMSAQTRNSPGPALDKQIHSEMHDEYPSCDWKPNDYEEMKDLVATVDHNLAVQREYWLQAALLQSVNRARQIAPNPSTTAKENPFKKLISSAKQAHRPHGEKKVVTSYKGGALNTKKPAVLLLTELGWDDKQPVLPQYKSIGRMGSNFVAKNIHTLKHLPYFPDDEAEEVRTERETWLRLRYRNNGHINLDEVVKELVDQRLCLERIHRWSTPFAGLLETLKLTPEIIVAYYGQEEGNYCITCCLDIVLPSRHASHVMISSDDKKRCVFLKKAFEAITKISMLHFFEEKFTGKLMSKNLRPLEQRRADSKPSICMICCVPNCAVHGLYVDGGFAENKDGPLINDPELENNRREQVVLKKPMSLSDHICGLYCEGVDTKTVRYSAFLGLDSAGALTGICNVRTEPVKNHIGFDGVKPCDRNCFIIRSKREGLADCKDREAREYLEKKMSSQQLRFLEVHTKLFKDSIRLPCSVARRLKLDCSETFKCIVMLHRSTISSSEHDPPVTINQGSKKAYFVRPDKWEDREVLKKSFLPCSHEGPCKKENGCPCAERDAHCEYSCGCDGSCYRRFPGCRCDGPCQSKKCDCFLYGRECDPWVCKSCGILEVLDPSNKYNEEIRHGRCRNNRTQLGLPARTVKGSSQIQGWGLFAGEDMPKSTYIGEYKGEIVTRGADHEGERRGLVYRQGGQEYLFDINGEQELDGSRFGNKMRFINHTHVKEVINLESRRQLVNGVARVSFWTARNIKAGEEFFYDYGYEEEYTRNFTTLDADLDLDPLLPIPKPVFTRTGVRRANQTAFQSDEESEDNGKDNEEAPPPSRTSEKQTKRKRKVNEGDGQMQDIPAVQQRGESMRTTVAKVVVKPISRQPSERRQPSPGRRTGTTILPQARVKKNISEDEDDDYTEPDAPSAESASEGDSVGSDEVIASIDDKPKKKKGRPRIADKVDKRRGGAAQKKAQETRKKNREKMGVT